MFPSLVFSPGLQPTTTTQANMSGKIEMNNCSQEFRLDTFLQAEYSAVLLHAAIPYCYSAIVLYHECSRKPILIILSLPAVTEHLTERFRTAAIK